MIILNEKLRLLKYINLSPKYDTSYGLIRFINKHIRHPSDISGVNHFFLRLYDELYHEIVFKKLKIQKKVLRIFESLAIPIEEQSERKLVKLCRQIKKVRFEMEKEKGKGGSKSSPPVLTGAPLPHQKGKRTFNSY
jgi:hypothetical protein